MFTIARRLLSGTAACAIISAGAVHAQESSTGDEEDVIVVTGTFQKSLANALLAKRTADQILDAVSAEDLGKLPDISIAESIARLPGVVANRDRGNASELSIRGLGPNLSNTLLNGREVATGDSSRNIRYESYPAELLNGAFLYKSPKASLVEGGVGGTVDLKTVRPLDFGEKRLVVNARASYFDLADEIEDSNGLGYTGSISYVDQFLDDELGLVLAYTRRAQPIASARTNLFPSVARSAFGNANTDEFDAAGVELVPFGYEALVRGGDDDRDGVVAAVQWAPNDEFQINADFFYSGVDFIEEQRGFRFGNTQNEFGNLFTDVTSTDGFITGATVTPTAGFGGNITTVNEQFTLFDDLFAGGLNAEWEKGPLKITGDVGYSRNDRESEFISVETQPHDVSGVPFEITSGLNGTFGPAADDSGRLELGFNFDLSDPSINLPTIVRIPTADTVVDEIYTYALDTEYSLSGKFFTSINAGLRYADRNKSLFARSDFPFIAVEDRVAIPDSLLGEPLTGAGSIVFPPTLTFDRQGVIDEVFGGSDPQQSNNDTTGSWEVSEEILAGYVSAEFESNLAGIPFSGNIGVRVASTELVSSSTFLQNGEETNFVEVLTPFSVSNDYTDVLPSLNLSFFPAEDHIIRVGLSKALARAPLDDLNAGVGEFNFGQPAAFGGNPLLEPFQTDQIDLTYEWYFAEGAALTVSGFYKDIDTFIVRETQVGVTLPSGILGNFTQPVNGEGGDITGVEISYTQPLTFLPGPLDGLGVSANYTYVDSSIEVGPAFVQGTFPLPGLAENSFNAQLWYFKNGFEARLGYKTRSAFPTELGDVPNQILFNDSEEIIDFQTSYAFKEGSNLDGLKLLFQANNLTDEPFQTFHSSEDARGRFEEFGRRYWVGLSYEF